MGAAQPLPMTTEDDTARDARLLAWDLACVAGASSEIGTTWRRAGSGQSGLPLELPEQLRHSAAELEAAAWSIATAGADQVPGEAALLARRVAVLTAEATAARTAGGDAGPDIGDGLLWEALTAALRDAAGHARQLAGR